MRPRKTSCTWMIVPKTSQPQLAWEFTLCCLTRSKRLHQESKADSTSLSRVMAAVANQVHGTAQKIATRIGWNGKSPCPQTGRLPPSCDRLGRCRLFVGDCTWERL